jgi:hypothetical protein
MRTWKTLRVYAVRNRRRDFNEAAKLRQPYDHNNPSGAASIITHTDGKLIAKYFAISSTFYTFSPEASSVNFLLC